MWSIDQSAPHESVYIQKMHVCDTTHAKKYALTSSVNKQFSIILKSIIKKNTFEKC